MHGVKDKLRQAKREEERREFHKAAWAILGLTGSGIIAYQAVSSIRSGELAGGYNFKWQPVGPGIQLVVCIPFFCCSVVTLWRFFRRKPERKRAHRKVIDPLQPPEDEK